MAPEEEGADADGEAVSWGPLPEIEVESGPEPEPRSAPTIETLDEAERALEEGFYDAVRQYLEKRSPDRGAPGSLLHARLDLVTGDYEGAARRARRAARSRSLRVEALTLRGEAYMRLGDHGEAEAALREVAEEPGAHRARVLLGRLLQTRGEVSEARRWYYRLIDAYNDDTIDLDDGENLAHVALAAWGLHAYHDANDAFQQATRAAPDRVETQLEWAKLFLEKYDTGHAEESVRHALERNPEHPEAHALLARIRIEQNLDFQRAEERVGRALEVNPNLVAAHVTRAGMALRDGDFEQADTHLARALEVNPNDLEALSVRAAVRLIAGDRRGFEQAEKAVLDRNARFGRMYTIIADYADWEHRYREIVALARKAVRIDPDDGLARATLGLNLMRTGEEKEGLASLRESWRRDRFNVQVYNTLELYDDVIPKQYEEMRRGPFVFRMHREEKSMLERYVPELLDGAYRDMVRRYRFEPEGPVRLELYGDDEHFAIRTTGLPRLGVQGVCFGKVITAVSPRAGPFNWGQITWHELAHVFHLQMSENRVPRWFTEGLAEYETIRARPEWRREMDHTLWLALEGGRLPELALLNQAFTHARSAEEMVTAYYMASQAVKYIVERFGMPKVVAMLRAWGRGMQTSEVVERVLDTDLSALDRDFRAHTRKRLEDRANDFTVDFARYTDLGALEAEARRRSDDPDARAALAVGLAVAGRAEEAVELARQVLSRDAEQPVARFLLGRIALARQAPDRARQHLKALLSAGKDGYEVRLLLARASAAGKEVEAARAHLEAASRIDPDRPEAWIALASLARRQGASDLRVRALARLARIDEHDRGAVAALLPLLHEQERWRELVTFGEMGVLVDPHRADNHRFYAEGLLRADKPDRALFELESALVAEPEHPGPVHLARVRALLALGRRARAKEAGEEAVRADPSLEPQVRQLLQSR
ncbi:MAG: tetratricopeptide repeat protein [Myxococcota bacterium]